MSQEVLQVLIKLADHFSPVAEKILKEVDKLGKQFDKAVIASSKLAKWAHGAFAGIFAASVRAYAGTEQLRMSFTALLGSTEAATDALDKLYEFAKRTPFELGDIGKLAQMLMALGFRFKDVIPLLGVIGDAVSALGGSHETLVRVARALAQIRSSAVASAQDLNQLAQAGIPVWQIIAEKMHVTVQQLREAMSTGLISAQDAFTAIIQGMQERYSGMMRKQSETLLGIYSNIKDGLDAIFAEIGERFVEAFRLREGMKRLENWLDTISDALQKGKIDEHLKRIAEAAKILGAALVGMMLPSIIEQFLVLGRALVLSARALGPWALLGVAIYKALKYMGVGMNDVMPALKRLGSGLVGLYDISAGVISILTALGSTLIQVLVGNLDIAAKRIKLRFQELSALFDMSLTWRERLKKYHELEQEALSIKFRPLSKMIAERQKELDAAADRIRHGADLIVDAITGKENSVTTAVEGFINGASKAIGDVGGLEDVLKGLGKDLGNVGAGFKNAGDSANDAAKGFENASQRLEHFLRLTRALSRTAGQLGATERQGEAPEPQEEYPLNVVAPAEGPREAGGAKLPKLYLTPEERRRVEELLELQRSLNEAGLRSLYITAQQAKAYEDYANTLKDLATWAGGYVAELDEATYKQAAARKRAEELYEQYKSLRLSLQAAGRTALYITQHDLDAYNKKLAEQQKEQAETNRLVAGYAAELDEATYALARQREAQEYANRVNERALKLFKELTGVKLFDWINNAAAGTQEWLKKWKEVRELAKQSGLQLGAEIAQGIREGIRGKKTWKDILLDVHDALENTVARLIDAVAPGVGTLLVSIFKAFEAGLEWLDKKMRSISPAWWKYMRQQAEKDQAKLAEGFAILSAKAFSTVKEESGRFLFWTWKQYKVVVDKAAEGIAQTLDTSVVSALSRGIRAFLTGAKDWRQQFARAIKEAILEGVIQAIINQAVIKAALQGPLDQLAKDLAAGNWEAANADLDRVMAGAKQVGDWLEKNLGRFKGFFSDLGQSSAGATTPTPTLPQGAQYTIAANIPTVQVAGPLNRLGPVLDRLSHAVDRLVSEGVKANVDVELKVYGFAFGDTMVGGS